MNINTHSAGHTGGHAHTYMVGAGWIARRNLGLAHPLGRAPSCPSASSECRENTC